MSTDTQRDTTEGQATQRVAQLLRLLGWQQIPTEHSLPLRGGSESEALLRSVLEERLKRINSFEHKGLQLRFSRNAILQAIQAIVRPDQEEVVYSNEKIWSLLKLGTQVREPLDGDAKSFTIRYIDWEVPENNAYHFIQELKVAGPSGTRTVDYALFVNGIPFVVIEAKSANQKATSREELNAAIEQLQEYQGTANIAQLFRYTQLLLAVSTRDGAYAPVGSGRHHWTRWRESHESSEAIRDFAQCRVEPPQIPTRLADWISTTPVHVNEQDRLIHALCRPRRLLELARWFTLFISGRRYIARHFQYFAVRAVLERVCKPEMDGRRPGGVVMHAQGSGKSLTMLMLSHVLLDVFRQRSPRVVLVTDRSEADSHLYGTLLASGIECRRTNTGRELRSLIQDRRVRAITTTIQKFGAAVNGPTVIADSPDIFVLIDEAHRAQTGHMHYAMRRMLPRACFIAFTGTPLDTRAYDVFGQYISTYELDDAIQDDVVVPARWELRTNAVERKLDKSWLSTRFVDDLAAFDDSAAFVDEGFSISTLRERDPFSAESWIKEVAKDVADHFNRHFAKSSLKGQLVAASRTAALLFKKHLDKIGTISSEVVISLDDANARDPLYEEFRQLILGTFGAEAKYEADLLRRFREADDPKIIIAVDKLLTGLDVPQCSVMYITRPLKEPALLQAIARINRPYEDKTQGLIVDYVGLIEEARRALSFGIEFSTAEKQGESQKSKHSIERTNETLPNNGRAGYASSARTGQTLSALEESCRVILNEEFDESGLRVTVATDVVCDLARRIADVIFFRHKVDWAEDLDLQNEMKSIIEDELFEMQSEEGVVLELKRIDAILDRCIASARQIAP